MSISEEKTKLILVDFINSIIEEEPWYITYLTNKGLLFSVIIMVIVAYQIIKSRSSSEEESEEFRGIKNLLKDNQNLQGKEIII